MSEVTYILCKDGTEYGTITRSEVHKATSYDQVIHPMIEALAKANKIASELFYDNQTKNWFSDHDRDQAFLELLEALSNALLTNKE